MVAVYVVTRIQCSHLSMLFWSILRHVCLWTSVHWSLMSQRLSAHWSLDRMPDKWNWGRQPNMSPDMLY